MDLISSLDELKTFLEKKGEKPYHASQIFQWIFQKGATSFDEMTNLSKPLRLLLQNEFPFPLLQEETIQTSEDKETTKFLWKLKDGYFVESVLINSDTRRTVCVSSQIGCKAKCAFCASGKKGFFRNLSAAEIVEQILQIQKVLLQKEERVSHVVFMGMGEPLDNYREVLKAIRILISKEGLGLSQRRITISTVGVIEGIKKLSDEGLQVNLVLSLHAPNQQLRQKIIPYAKKYPLDEIFPSLDLYFKKTSRDLTFEYILISGVNDRKEDAIELASMLIGKQCSVNLIPYNPIDYLGWKRPEKEVVAAFRKILQTKGIITTWRYTKGKDIAAACGQLALRDKEKAN